MITERCRSNPHNLLSWLRLKLVVQSSPTPPDRRPRIEQLAARRLLSATAPSCDTGNPQVLPDESRTATPPAISPVEPGTHFPVRQHVTDSVLALVAQAPSQPKRGRVPPPPSTIFTRPQAAQHPEISPVPTNPDRTDRTTNRSPASLFPQGDPAPPFQLPGSIPLGLFRDGSVRSVDPGIDPHVYQAWQSNRQGPIEQTLHRSTSLYGAPIRMAAGTDPQLLILAGLKPNWAAATGNLTYSQQSIFIPQIKPGMSTETIYRQLKDFRHFDQDNLAQVKVIRAGALAPTALQQRQFALFRVRLLLETKPLHTHWALANTLQGLVNSNPVAVELHYHDKLRMVEAITIGNHMLVGSRRWHVIETSKQSVRVTSEAWVHANGKLNEFAMQSLGPLAMKRIWSQYLANIGEAVTADKPQFVTGPVIHYDLTIAPNGHWPHLAPWPPVRHPGTSELNEQFFNLPAYPNPSRP